MALKPMPFGSVFGELTVLDRTTNDFYGRSRYWAVCTCGLIHEYEAMKLRSGHTRSCGQCNWNKKQPVEYAAWRNMNERCRNPKHQKWEHYGARGILVCEEWQNSFAQFFLYIGPKPFEEFSLDRYPNKDGNYEPGNVRWATYYEQNHNRRAA